MEVKNYSEINTMKKKLQFTIDLTR